MSLPSSTTPLIKLTTSYSRRREVFYCIFEQWRRRRDSNPRDPFESNGFQDRRFQPLTHSSVFNSNVFHELAATLLHSGPLLLHFGARCSRFVAVPASFPTATTFEARFECV